MLEQWRVGNDFHWAFSSAKCEGAGRRPGLQVGSQEHDTFYPPRLLRCVLGEQEVAVLGFSAGAAQTYNKEVMVGNRNDTLPQRLR